jgi:hypothetical protein
MVGCCSHGNEPSLTMKYGEFMDFVSCRRLLQKDPACNLTRRQKPSSCEAAVNCSYQRTRFQSALATSSILLHKAGSFFRKQQLLKKLLALYGATVFIALFTWNRHWFLSSAHALTPFFKIHYHIRSIYVFFFQVASFLPFFFFAIAFRKRARESVTRKNDF